MSNPFKLITKAWKIEHEKLVWLDPDIIVLAANRNQARIKGIDELYLYVDDTPLYINVRATRSKENDQVSIQGMDGIYSRHEAKRIINEKRYIELCEKLPDGMYYIQKLYKWSGDYMVFWRLNSAGYTSDLSMAQQYTKAEMLTIVKHGEAAPWPVDEIDNKSNRVVNFHRVEPSATPQLNNY